MWTLYDGDEKRKKAYYVEFPQQLMANEHMKMAILCAWKCNEPFAFMHELVESLLKGLNIAIEEVVLSLDSVPRKIRLISPNGTVTENWPNYKHAGLLITSKKTKKQWVFDFSGSQYGIHQAFWDWEVYQKQFDATFNKAYPPGTHHQLFQAMSQVPGNPTLTYGVLGEAAKDMHIAALAWERESGVLLTRIRAMSDDEYDQHRDGLFLAMRNAVKDYMANNDCVAKFKASQEYIRKDPGRSEEMLLHVNHGFFQLLENLATE
ncbi:hypothetical protein NX059_007157 [Plenodomus lindquistii]|nr:hypothetical protein NX059_007157 [Plenodomus lindquistii]